ncbi:MAG: DsbA family protein [Candidatus Paceibacteria bacterium]
MPETESNQKNNTVLNVIIGITIVLAVGFLIFFVMQGSSNPGTQSGEVPPVSEQDHKRGNTDNPDVTVIEYGDFQCPACKRYKPLLDKLIKENDNVQFVYRHYPLTQVHQNAQIAAQASEAAANQGAFWKYHDKLFEAQDEWKNKDNPKETFIAYAEELGLDTDQFKKDMTSSEIKKRVSEESRNARQAGVQSTPTIVVDGQILNELPSSYEGSTRSKSYGSSQ